MIFLLKNGKVQVDNVKHLALLCVLVLVLVFSHYLHATSI